MRTKRGSKEWRKKVSKGWFKKGQIPPNKGIPLSGETKKRLSKALRGKTPWNKGLPLSETTKKRLSNVLKGRRRSPGTEFKKGQFLGNKNPAKRPEVRIKISQAKKGKPHFNQRGENHPRWKGGLSSSEELFRKSLAYKSWRENIFNRDDWTCQKCKKKGGKINAHHIYNFASAINLRISVENGITLCKNCHVGFHKTYGIKNNTKQKLKKFLNEHNYHH